MRFAARSATTDVRRHSSRSLMFEDALRRWGVEQLERIRIAYE
jgi:hypothetical protein